MLLFYAVYAYVCFSQLTVICFKKSLIIPILVSKIPYTCCELSLTCRLLSICSLTKKKI